MFCYRNSIGCELKERRSSIFSCCLCVGFCVDSASFILSSLLVLSPCVLIGLLESIIIRPYKRAEEFHGKKFVSPRRASRGSVSLMSYQTNNKYS